MSETFHRIYLSDGSCSVAIDQKKPIKDYFVDLLYSEEKEQLFTLSREERKIEFLGVRQLRNEFNLLSPIHYTDKRKPFLSNLSQTFISISHSENYCALGVSNQDLGIDIEEVSPRIERISPRFLNDDEKQFIGEHSTVDLTKVWTMKEAMFKLNNRTGIEFKTELIIEEKFGDIYSGKMLTNNGWKQVKLECFQEKELVISACIYA